MSALLMLLAQAQAPPLEAGYEMSAGGWTLMIFSVGLVTCLLGWCVYKVVATPGSTEHLHTQADIEPPDTKEP